VGRAGAKAVAARAHDADLVVSGMNGCLHDLVTSFPNHSILKDARRIQQMGVVGLLLLTLPKQIGHIRHCHD
jgi:hypothetical protein